MCLWRHEKLRHACFIFKISVVGTFNKILIVHEMCTHLLANEKIRKRKFVCMCVTEWNMYVAAARKLRRDIEILKKSRQVVIRKFYQKNYVFFNKISSKF